MRFVGWAAGVRVAVLRLGAACAPLFLGGCSGQMVLLHPAGPVGTAEKGIFLTAFALMLIVVLPVFAMLFFFAWRYRASNKRAFYAPGWASSRAIEVAVWTVPVLIVGALGYLTWTSTHALNPYRPLASAARPLDVDVVALNWKWLFIYPDQHIATVNELVIPADVPVSFRLTSETVMTSFFIPRLGTQIYAMPGMRTKLHLMADRPGVYTGLNYNFSGRGYSAMHFEVKAVSIQAFEQWAAQAKRGGQALDAAALRRLEKPSVANPVRSYSDVAPHLFARIVHRTMTADRAPSGLTAENGAG